MAGKPDKECGTGDGTVDNIKQQNNEDMRDTEKFCTSSLVVEKNILDFESIEEELERISQMKQKQRELLKSKEVKKENVDQRLDDFIDGLFAAFFKWESHMSDKAAGLINKVDVNIDRLSNRILQIPEICHEKRVTFQRWAKGHKRQLISILCACAFTTAVAAIIIGNLTAYEYMYNGKVLGTVKDRQDVFMTIDVIGDKLTYAYGAEVKIDKDENISFNKIIGWNLKIDDKDDVLNTLTYLRDMNANAYAIMADGKQVAVLDSKKRAEEILETIKDKYTVKDDSVEYKSVDFLENVEVKEINTKIKNIRQGDEVLDYMLTGAVEKKVHIVQDGDTFNQIAKDYGLKPNELQVSNQDVKTEDLHIGQELSLTRVCPVLTVQTKELVTYKAKMDYEITYEETSTLFKGEQTVKIAGAPGERQVKAEVVRCNGIEVSRNEISSEVIKEPKTQVVIKGTKNVPALVGTGSFNYPTRGSLSSRFGTRWGRMHYGIDLAAPVGTKIRASDGGTVIFAGRQSSYGNVIKIDHGGNRVTVYAHCSKLLVSKGSKVYQGQHIANVGNTGRSTGPHLHFEVRINGVAKNPLKYLK
ncbi:MAG: peptidoglycan DD-metalloendopeptidase family protein [Eubacteriales bacterium]|nr:peptidoglycan DD-metalloendopeptidase family protein [Eubacteriales bacterium]MDD3873519.1 peptidoglycan DD-metalloendopeptidase family protein [Methanosarcina sp.]MDD4582665.1 peptidoglycan DD-metalloendopeptidase family protein [Eubacteriales bacterium]